jgi:parvulin-like peptidyl-prolyl isomerase
MHNASVGFIYGPFHENYVITAAKLIDKRSIPDSVRASHILIAFVGAERANPNVTRNFQQAEAMADSLFEVVKADNNNFAAYAITNSDDGSAGNGGDLEWFQQGMMTRPFNDYCFLNKKGDIGLVRSEFGFHIIKITDQGGSNPGVKVGIVDMRVLAGNETEDQFYLSSNKLAGESKTIEQFRSGALALGKEARPATGIREADRNVPGIANSRSIVRWGFSEIVKEGAVQISELEGKIVVAFLVRKREEGYTPMDDIKEQVRAEVLKEKKAEMIMAQFKAATGKSIEELATANGLQAQNLIDLRFTNPSLMGIGYEPKVVGAIFGAKENVVAGPITGESGVFVVKVVSVNRPTETGDLAVEKQSLQSTYTNRASSSVFEALKENAKIEDRRAKFY